jgi:hypothetical protein
VPEALAMARDARDTCADEVESRPSGACSAWLLAKSARQIAFLEEIVASGIADPSADPEATLAAYERSTRALRIVAMR